MLDKNYEREAFGVLVSQREGSELVGSEPRRAWPCLMLAPCLQTPPSSACQRQGLLPYCSDSPPCQQGR